MATPSTSADPRDAGAAEWIVGGGAREVVELLLRRGLLDARSIVAGDLVVVDVSRRNRNFAALRSDGPQYLVKTAEAPDRMATLTHERSVYEWLSSRHPGVAEHLAPLADAGRGYLVVEWRRGSRNLRELHQGRARPSPGTARAVGRILAAVHSVPLASSDRLSAGPSAHAAAPWILSLDAVPLSILRELSMANHEHIRMIQASPGASRLLHRVASSWSASSFCHNDLRWDNCVAYELSGASRRRGLSIVDWELASAGDPCWDVGCFFAEHVGLWAATIAPVGGAEGEADLVGVPTAPLSAMQPAIQGFWDAYLRSGGESRVSELSLVRAVEMMGIRLLQTALEQGQRSVHPTGVSATLLQLGLNVLEDPEEAALGVLGLDPYG